MWFGWKLCAMWRHFGTHLKMIGHFLGHISAVLLRCFVTVLTDHIILTAAFHHYHHELRAIDRVRVRCSASRPSAAQIEVTTHYSRIASP